MASAEFQCESKALNSGESAEKARLCGKYLRKMSLARPRQSSAFSCQGSGEEGFWVTIKAARSCSVAAPGFCAATQQTGTGGCLFQTSLKKPPARPRVASWRTALSGNQQGNLALIVPLLPFGGLALNRWNSQWPRSFCTWRRD